MEGFALNVRLLLALCTVALEVVSWPVWAAPGNLMEMTTTTTMKMAGMPAIQPQTHTTRICTSAAKPDARDLVPHRKDCRVSDYRQSGDTVSYHMSCAGKMEMQGDTRLRMSGDGSVHGTVHMTAADAGHPMVMDSVFDGKRIGKCDYTSR